MANALKFAASFAFPLKTNMLTVLFSFSLVAIALLLGFKIFENKTKRRTIILKSLSKFDTSLSRYLEIGLTKYESGVNQINLFIKEQIPNHTKELINLSKTKIQNKYATMLPNIRGSRPLNQNGNTSEFLKDIAKHKEENGGGRIEG